MSNKSNSSVKQIEKNQQRLGTKYHEEHSSHVPDYGANIVDPNAEGLTNNSNSNNQ